MYAKLDFRPHVAVTSHMITLIANLRCWHFDAWLARHQGTYYYIVETRAGGRDRLTQWNYMVHPGGLRFVPELPDRAELCTFSDRDVRGAYAHLNALHWRHIVPMSKRKPDMYRSRSIAMHYIRAPSHDPMEGIRNHFSYTPGQ